MYDFLPCDVDIYYIVLYIFVSFVLNSFKCFGCLLSNEKGTQTQKHDVSLRGVSSNLHV